MRANLSTLCRFAIVAGVTLSVSATAVLAQQQPPRQTPFSQGALPGTQPPRALPYSAPGAMAAAQAGSCSLCYTCGADWPTFAGQIGNDNTGGLNGPATERGPGCSGNLAPSNDVAPYLCCRP